MFNWRIIVYFYTLTMCFVDHGKWQFKLTKMKWDIVIAYQLFHSRLKQIENCWLCLVSKLSKQLKLFMSLFYFVIKTVVFSNSKFWYWFLLSVCVVFPRSYFNNFILILKSTEAFPSLTNSIELWCTKALME